MFSLPKSVCWLLAGVLSLAGMEWGSLPALAGASSAGWVVVVNGASKDSRTLANHFCHLRNIPARNVIVLENVPIAPGIDVDRFRERILGPVLAEIDARGISKHVQGIAYSCDFPTAIDLQEDVKNAKNLPKVLTPVGSINGMTSLFRLTMNKDINYLSLDINWYASQPADVLLRIYSSDEGGQEELVQWIEQGKHGQVAGRFDEMRSQSPQPFPLDYLAARFWALAGEPDKALDRLAAAIQHGWRFRSELTKEPAFQSLQDNPEFKTLVTRCPNDTFNFTHSRGFDARNFYAPNTLESRNPKFGMNYLLSVMLGYNKKERLRLEESIEVLERSALA
ncbi:MAG: TPR end-of-group domain-containing protein, partial [Pirellula sp.]